MKRTASNEQRAMNEIGQTTKNRELELRATGGAIGVALAVVAFGTRGKTEKG